MKVFAAAVVLALVSAIALAGPPDTMGKVIRLGHADGGTMPTPRLGGQVYDVIRQRPLSSDGGEWTYLAYEADIQAIIDSFGRRLPIAGGIVAGAAGCSDPGDGGRECLTADALNTALVTRDVGATGQYTVYMTTPASDIYYVIQLSTISSSVAVWEIVDSSTFNVSCTDQTTGTDENCSFSYLVHDFKASE